MKPRYKEDGCELFSKCVNCNLDECKYVTGKNPIREKRDKEIIKLAEVYGWSTGELEREFGLAKRTITKILSGK